MDDPTCQWTDPRTGHVCGMYADVPAVPLTTPTTRRAGADRPDVLCPEHRADHERRHGIQAV